MHAQPPTGHAGNPADALQRTFAAIAATRMAGLPVCNPALTVAVPAMRRHEGEWLGVLLTPWALSLVILPGGGGQFRAIAVGESQDWAFPSGSYTFLGSSEDGLGPYQTCSLFSPVFEFDDQASAEAVALAAFDALLQPGEGALDSAAAAREDAEAARLAGRPLSSQAVSRRAFLRGSLFGGRE
ncbi:[NiFe]-hydrogenase assembly chaperone HybE [Azoarcus sp. TTM-91]|nr:[NiFe]-hydrogenase assembly chaperone HybE [Azoarcus sp. TTM-91]